MANRFSKIINPPRFSPLSLEEQSIAPIALRQREDEVLNNKDLILNELNNVQVPDVYQDLFDKERAALEGELNGLADKIQKEGAGNLNYINEFRNLRNKYNKSVSAQGNIGKAAGAKTEMDAMKDAWYADAYKKGQPAAQIDRNWQIQKDKFINGLPSDLSNFKGNLPNFTPEFAPEAVGLHEKVKEMATMMTGLDSETKEGFYFDVNPETGGLMAIDRLTGEASNHEQVEHLRKLVESNLFNPDSDVNRNLKWRGIDPATLIDDIDNYAGMMEKMSTKDITKISHANMGGKKGRGTTTTKPGQTESKAGLQVYRGGLPKLMNSQNTAAIQEKIQEIQHDDTLSDNDKNRLLQQYNAGYNHKKKFEQSSEFKNRSNEEIKQLETFKARGISSYQDYLDWNADPNNELVHNIQRDIENYKEYKPKGGNDIYDKLKNLNSVQIRKQIENNSKLINFYLDDNFSYSGGYNGKGPKESVVPNREKFSKQPLFRNEEEDFNNSYSAMNRELLKPMRYWGYDQTKDSRDIQKELETGFSHHNLSKIAAEGLLKIRNADGELISKDDKTTEGVGVMFDTFDKRLLLEKSPTLQLQGFSDGGVNGNVVLDFNVILGSGDNLTSQQIGIELDPEKLNKLTSSFLNPGGTFYSKLDKEGQNVMDGIRDKNEFGTVATDNPEIASEGELYNEKDTANIVQHSRKEWKRTTGYDVTDTDNFANNFSFYKQGTKDQYSVQVNEDNSYSAYKKDVDGNKTAYTFNDYALKDGFAAASRTTDGVALMKSDADERDYYTNYGKAHTLHQLANSTADFGDSSTDAVMYSTSAAYQEVLEEYEKNFKYLFNEEKTSEAVITKVAKLFDKIKDLRVQSKLIKEIL